MKLIITEKPSVASDFSRAMGGKRKNGYFEAHGYIITFCVGHLLTLYEPHEYDGELKTWQLESLPIIPDEFKHKPIPSTKKQLSVIKSLISSHTFSEIILATDAGREGQLIGMLTLSWCRVPENIQIKRFWQSEALTPAVIKKGLSRLRDNDEFDRLYKSGYYRQVSDWTCGINFSRFFSITLKGLFSVGRVQTAVLNLLAKRQREIDSFKPEPYFQLQGTFSQSDKAFKGLYVRNKKTRFDTRAEIENTYEAVKGETTARVKNIENKQVTSPPPLLFNLTTLQREANKRYGFSADRTLKIAQSLYEKHKCLSYPRTPSRVMGEEDVGLVREKTRLLSTTYPDYFPDIRDDKITKENKRVFDNNKLEDHHALIPVAVLPEEAREDERLIYFLVLRSFSAAFHPDFTYDEITVTLDVGDNSFVSKGKSIIRPGWTAVLKPEKTKKPDDDEADNELPNLKNGETIRALCFEILEKMTSPPPAFTENSLLKVMENPQRYCSENHSFKKGSGIGTEATRASIIETLIQREYVMRMKKSLVVTKKGFHLLDEACRFEEVKGFIEIEETARWEELLEKNPASFFSSLCGFIRKTIPELKTRQFAAYAREVPDIGNCPVCGAPVRENSKSFYCSSWKKGCKFSIWKSICGTPISRKCLLSLLAGKKSGVKTFRKKNGDSFKAALELDSNKNLVFSFTEKR